MATDPYGWRGIWISAVTGLVIIAVACGLQALFAPTVRLACPARNAAATDCTFQWLVAFDTVPVRNLTLRGLQSAGEVERVGTGARGRSSNPPYTMYLATATERVRTILWGDYMELQTFRSPLEKYLASAQAPPLDVTMWPSTHPWRTIASVIVVFGLFCWIWLPVQVAVALKRTLLPS